MAKFPVAASEDRLIVRRDKEQDITKGGIHLPDTAKKKTMTATILDVGPPGFDHGHAKPPLPWKPGNRIWFNLYAGHELELDQSVYNGAEKLFVIHRDDILATER